MSRVDRRQWCDLYFDRYKIACDRVKDTFKYKADGTNAVRDEELRLKCQQDATLHQDLERCAEAREEYDVVPMQGGKTCADLSGKVYRDGHTFEAARARQRASFCTKAALMKRRPRTVTAPSPRPPTATDAEPLRPDLDLSDAFLALQSDDSDEVVTEEEALESASQKDDVAASTAAKTDRTQRKRRAEEDEAALLNAQAEDETRYPSDAVVGWIITKLRYFCGFVAQITENAEFLEYVQAKALFARLKLSGSKTQPTPAHLEKLFARYLDELHSRLSDGLRDPAGRFDRRTAHILDQFTLLSHELLHSLARNRPSFRHEIYDEDAFLVLLDNLVQGGEAQQVSVAGKKLLIRRPGLSEADRRTMDPLQLVDRNTGLLALFCEGRSLRMAASWMVSSTKEVGVVFDCLGCFAILAQRLLEGHDCFRISFHKVPNGQLFPSIAPGADQERPEKPAQMESLMLMRRPGERCVFLAQFQRVVVHHDPPTMVPPNCLECSLPYGHEKWPLETESYMLDTGVCVDFSECQFTWRAEQPPPSPAPAGPLWQFIADSKNKELLEGRDCLTELRAQLKSSFTVKIDETALGKVVWKESGATYWKDCVSAKPSRNLNSCVLFLSAPVFVVQCVPIRRPPGPAQDYFVLLALAMVNMRYIYVPLWSREVEEISPGPPVELRLFDLRTGESQRYHHIHKDFRSQVEAAAHNCARKSFVNFLKTQRATTGGPKR